MRGVINWLGLSLLLAVLGGCSRDEPATLVQAEAKGCDAALAECRIRLEGVAVTLKLGSGVEPLKPFAIRATIEAAEQPEQVVIDFQMRDMEMGLNRYRLLPQQGEWQGRATLPVCSASRMDWDALLEFTLAGRAYRLHFPFTTQ